MKTFAYSFKSDEIIIVPIGDTHIGSNEFQEHKLREQIEQIKSNKNTYCILNGDILDMCIPDSVASADIYNSISPAVALGLACKMFEPIKDKILLVTEGNHEARQTKLTMISPLVQMCVFLGIQDKYVPSGAYLFLTLEQRKGNTKSFGIYVTHGTSNSSEVGGKIKKLSDYANMVDADCYIVGHSHLPATFKQDYIKRCEQNRTIKQCTRLYVNLCSYLSFGGYGERKGYIPSTIAQPKIIFRLRRKQVNNKEFIEQEMYCIV